MGFFQTLGQGYMIMGQEAKQGIIDNRANIFTGISVIGTIATSVVSWIGGMRSARQIDAKTAELGRPLETKEKVQLCWKNVILPAGTVLISGTSGITSNRIMAGDITRLTADAAIATRAYNELKRATNEVVTEKQQKQIQHEVGEQQRKEIDQQKLDEKVEPVVPEGAARLALFKEPVSRIVFFSTEDKVAAAVAKMETEMALMKPRSYDNPKSNLQWGVPLSRFFEILQAIPEDELEVSRKTDVVLDFYGFNKGYWKDGINDDDHIGYGLDPGETYYRGEKRLCYVIDWDKYPSDMNLGNKLKNPESIYYEPNF